MSEFDDDVFHMDPISGKIFLDKEVDADSLPSNIFLLRVSTRWIFFTIIGHMYGSCQMFTIVLV